MDFAVTFSPSSLAVRAMRGRVTRTVAYLLAGQSNMTGFAYRDGGPDYPEGILEVARTGGTSGGSDGELVQAVHQLDHVNCDSALYFGPGLHFAIDWVAANPGKTLVLIPAAQGATGLVGGPWKPGTGSLYLDAVARANALFAAHPDYEFGGILWGQGEQDVIENRTAADYRATLHALIEGLRTDIDVAGPMTPVSIQGFTSWFVQNTDYPDAAVIQGVLENTPNEIPFTAYIDTSDLADNSSIHFPAAGMSVLGSRHLVAQNAARENGPTLPAKVTGLVATAGDGEVVLSWDEPSAFPAPASYKVRRDGSVIGSGVSGTQYADTGLTNGQSYSYEVAAMNDAGTGPFSDAEAATPTAGSPAEAGATGHWLLGSDNAAYSGLTGGVLTAENIGPTLSAGYATLGDGTDSVNGLRSGLTETADMTLCYVLRLTSGSPLIILGGDLTNTGLKAGGWSPAVYSGVHVYQNNASGSVTDTGPKLSGLALDEFIFIGVSIDASGGVVVFTSDSANGERSDTGTLSPRVVATSQNTLGIGNITYTGSLFDSVYDLAEAIVFDSALGLAELQAVKSNSQARMAARGITLA